MTRPIPRRVAVYTDGACSGNPGPGGWAAVLMSGDHHREISGGEPRTTNNRMELMAIIQALEAFRKPAEVTIHTDSAYVVNCFRDRWYERWQRNGWMTVSKKPVENRDLWERLLDAVRPHRVKWVKVRGHSGDRWNERCDELARQEAARFESASAGAPGR